MKTDSQDNRSLSLSKASVMLRQAQRAESRLDRPIYHVARLVLETKTPLSIAAGRSGSLYDNLLVRDANSLPAIPGSSLAGVLRALYFNTYAKTDTDALFGTADKDRETPSRLQVSWGYLHDKNDKPMEKLHAPDELAASADEVIQDALAAAPLRRDHVKLNHRGVSDAEKQGKFDRVSLTAGHRFSVELSLWSDSDNDSAWNQLLALLHHPLFRLGSNTRRGLGRLDVVRCATGCFRLGKGDVDGKELARFSQLSQSLADTSLLTPHTPTLSAAAAESIELYLTPLAEGFRFGGIGQAWDEKHSDADMTPLIEKQVIWDSGRPAHIEPKMLLFSASAFKGALSHRVAYHYNLLHGIFADEVKDLDAVVQNNAAVRELFGYVEEKKPVAELVEAPVARAGCVLFDDLYLTKKDGIKSVQLPHSGIDRFTGGVREGVLFFEEIILREQLLPVIKLTLTEPKECFAPQTITALENALNDLCNGYLALGAGSGRGGYGYFTGTWNWIEQGVQA